MQRWPNVRISNEFMVCRQRYQHVSIISWYGYVNEDISSWDVSNVVNMMSMFRFASSFNGDLSSWDTSSLQGMNSMFDGATAFESDLSGKSTRVILYILVCFYTF